MKFVVGNVELNEVPRANLSYVTWNDWWKFSTTHQLTVTLPDGKVVRPGAVKIGQVALGEGGQLPEGGYVGPDLPPIFDELPEGFFSVGQTETYYETIFDLPNGLSETVFRALRDCAFDTDLLERYRSEPVMRESLLRYVDGGTVRRRLHGLATGSAALTEFQFSHPILNRDGTEGPLLEFSVTPHSWPPSNMHALIGRNGVGKTRYISGLVEKVANPVAESAAPNAGSAAFSGLVSVSFSAFDSITPVVDKERSRVQYHRIGLHSASRTTDDNDVLSTAEGLRDAFIASLAKCRSDVRIRRWSTAVESLETDPLIAESGIRDLGLTGELEAAGAVFDRMSSGHAAVLLTITKLVEHVQERTLVLIDEPESHLHPPLLSSLVRTVSDLLINRNGVAMVATHSPVVLQEVPRSCVWVMRRSGLVSSVGRPEIETFGENVGTLTSEVFGLEVTAAGFHALLRQTVENGDTYEDAVARFGGELGMEARIILRSMVAEREQRAGQNAD